MGIGKITPEEIEETYLRFYSAVNCPDVVVETDEIGESEEWMKKQYQDGTMKRLGVYSFYYKEDRKQKVYCVEEGEP